MIRISQTDARILRDDHRAITHGEAGRGSLHRLECGGGGYSEEYNGYFKVVYLTDENGENGACWVVDGADDISLISDAEDKVCGYVSIYKPETGLARVAVDNDFFEVTEDEMAIYLDVVTLTQECTLKKSSPSMPEYIPDGHNVYHLATVHATYELDENGEETEVINGCNITQIHKSGEIFINLTWESLKPFKIIDDSVYGENGNIITPKVKVVDGRYWNIPSYSYSGYIYHGATRLVDTASFVAGELTRIWLYLKYTDGDYEYGLTTSYTQEDADNRQYVNINVGVVSYKNSVLTISQNLDTDWTVTGRIL